MNADKRKGALTLAQIFDRKLGSPTSDPMPGGKTKCFTVHPRPSACICGFELHIHRHAAGWKACPTSRFMASICTLRNPKNRVALRFRFAHNIRMLARVWAAAVNGIEAYPVEVEVDAGWGDTNIIIVGLPDAAVKESRDRVTTALNNSGFKFPMGRTTINLAPADVKKEGPSFDLPIALGMLAASEQIETDQLDNFVIVGELALTGTVGPVGFLSVLHN
jgi:hypothetical protein